MHEITKTTHGGRVINHWIARTYAEAVELAVQVAAAEMRQEEQANGTYDGEDGFMANVRDQFDRFGHGETSRHIYAIGRI